MDDLLVEVLAGLAVGVGMGLVGAGGAILTVPAFGALLGHAPKDAVLEALAVTGGIAAVSAAVAAARRSLDLRLAAVFAASGILGAQVAAPIAVRMDPRLQVSLFSAFAAYAAWRMWSPGDRPVAGSQAADGGERRSRWGSVALGAAIGALTSMLGVGGGFLLIPALVVRERLPMAIAVGTSLAVIAANSFAGLAGQWWSGGFEGSSFDLTAVATTTGFGLVGSLAGSMLAPRIPQHGVKRFFAVLLGAVAAWMAFRAFAAP